MARFENKLPQEELDALVKVYQQKKKENPSRIDRTLTYRLYNQFFNSKQRDVNACTCMDRDTDIKVVAYVEANYKVEEPLPIQSNVSIDISSMTAGGDVLTIFGEEEETKPAPKKRARTTRKKKTDEGEKGTI